MYGSMMTSNKALLDSRDDIDEIDQLFSASVQPAIPIQQLPPSRPKSPPRASQVPPVPAGLFSSASIPVSTNPNGASSSSVPPVQSASPSGFGSAPVHSTLTEPVWHTLRRDMLRVATNVWTVVFPCFSGAEPGKALRDWDLWGPLFFIIFLALTLSSSASHNKSVVFAVVFAVLSSGAVILTLNVILLGGKIIFFQSLSVLGYCLFPLDAGALICLGWDNKLFRSIVVLVSLAWSSWSAYPFLSSAVPPARKSLAVYPVFLLYVAVGFLVLAND